MQQIMQASKAKSLFSSFLVSCTMILLFSCTKNSADMPARDNTGETGANPASRAQVSHIVETLPYERTFYVPCANGGEGEEVLLTGTINIVDQNVYNDHGFALTHNTNPQGLTGVGLTTGETYVASGGSPGTITGAFENNQFTGYYHEQVRIISQNTTFLVNYKFHVTVTSDGEITTRISEETVDCRM